MPANNWLTVPGARLHYEVQGSGPVLMLIGHPMDSSGFAAIASVLATDHTVVTYDPRGYGQSTIEDPDQDAEPDLIANEVFRVLEAVGHGPADLFGSSGGAVNALAVAAHYPDAVRTVVAHEPPLAAFLPDAAEAERQNREIYETYRTSGALAAWPQFMTFAGIQMAQPRNAPPPDNAVGARATAVGQRFFGHSLLPVTLYRPDLAALQKPSPRVVIAAGTTSKGQYPHRAAAALAERLGTPLVEFPGGHAGFVSDAEAFATVLRRTLAAAPS